MLCLEHEWHYRSGNLQKDMFLVCLTSNDNEDLVGLVNFDFRILWRNMKTKNSKEGLQEFEKMLAKTWSWSEKMEYVCRSMSEGRPDGFKWCENHK